MANESEGIGVEREKSKAGASIDIHEQVQAAQRESKRALQVLHDRAQGVLDGMGEAFVLLDPDLRILDINAEGLRLEGRPKSDIVGKTHEEAHPNADPELAVLFRRVFNERKPVGLEHRYQWPDGRQTWIDMRAYPIGNHVAVFYRDVTERKLTEEALTTSERELKNSAARLDFLDRLGTATAPLDDADAVLSTTTRLLGEYLGVSVCAYADMDKDQDGFTIRGDWAAPGSISIVGHYSLTDFGRLAVKNLSAGLPLVVNDNLRELAPEEAATFQHIGIAATICMPLVKAGRLCALMAIHDKVSRVWTEADINVLREVTSRSWAHVERVGAFAELRASAARLRDLNADLERQVIERTQARGRSWQVSPDLMGALNSQGYFETSNPAWLTMLGWSEDEVARMSIWELLHPDDLERTRAGFALTQIGQPAIQFPNRYRCKDGDYRWISWVGVPENGMVYCT